MRKAIIIFLLLFTTTILAQTKNKLAIISLTKSCKLGFGEYDKEFKLYKKPFILKEGKRYKIQGYDNENYSGGQILSISPNKKYIVLDYISKGYVDDGVNKTLHENYLCVIVDVMKRKVVTELQEDCGGSWNKQNRWVNDGKVVF